MQTRRTRYGGTLRLDPGEEIVAQPAGPRARRSTAWGMRGEV
jgi:hypothetical protein